MSLLEGTPTTTVADARRLAQEVYGVEASVSDLPSERDRNFRLDAADGTVWVLKVSNSRESRDVLVAQSEAALRGAGLSVPVQTPRLSLSGDSITVVDGHFVRLMEHLPGVLLASVPVVSSALRHDLGHVLGRLALALEGWDHPAAHRDFPWDVALTGTVVPPLLPALTDPHRRALVETALERFARVVVPRLPALRRAVIHGDANDHNILIDPGTSHDPGGCCASTTTTRRSTTAP